MSPNTTRVTAFTVVTLLTTLAPALSRAQSYECEAPLGTNCRAALLDAYNRRGVFTIGQTTSSMVVTPGACDARDAIVDVDLNVEILHPYIGDLELSLTSPGGTNVALLYRPGLGVIDGNCPNDDLSVSIDDDDGTSDDEACAGTLPALSGSVIPFNPMSAFDGQARNGTWTLTVRDHVPGEQGVLLGWSLDLPCVADLPDVNLDATDNLVAERGADDSATITFTRGGDTDEAVTVEYVVTGTASLNDFEDLSGSIEIDAGDDSATLDISAIADDQAELQETIVVTLLAGDGYEIGPRNTATVTVLDETLVGGQAGQGGEGGDSGEGGEGGDSGEGGEGGDSGEGGASGGDPDAGPDGGTAGDDDDGCSCRIANASRGPSPLALGFGLLLAAALIRRRTRS